MYTVCNKRQKSRVQCGLIMFCVLIFFPLYAPFMRESVSVVKNPEESLRCVQMPKASISLFEMASYPHIRDSLEFEQARYWIESGKDVQRGLDVLHDLASRRFPDVRAQVFLGVRARKEGNYKDAEYFLSIAATLGHPVAQEHLAKLYLDTKRSEEGLIVMCTAAQPRKLHGSLRYYYHRQAIEYLASIYEKSPSRLSEASLYFARLAAELSDDKKRWKQLGQLLLEEREKRDRIG